MVRSREIEVGDLSIEDIENSPVWEFPRTGETVVVPVADYPVSDMTFRLIASQVQLANGTRLWSIIGNVSPKDFYRTAVFINVSFLKDGKWFALARYFDSAYEQYGPEAFARFLGVPTEDVFPLAYDIRPYVLGEPRALAGLIEKEPKTRLSIGEIMKLAVG